MELTSRKKGTPQSEFPLLQITMKTLQTNQSNFVQCKSKYDCLFIRPTCVVSVINIVCMVAVSEKEEDEEPKQQ